MKKIVLLLLAVILVILSMAGCGGKTEDAGQQTPSTGSKPSGPAAYYGPVSVAISLADSSDYYIGTMVGANVAAAFEEAGAQVDILDAGTQINVQLQQIQNAVTKDADIIYVFPVGDAEVYHETLSNARAEGVKIIVSNNYPGEGAYGAYVGSEEFYMGAMQALMVSNWIDNALPDATQVKTLILEAHFNEAMAHRCLGMRLISEKFLRRGDVEAMYFVSEDGPPVNYIDAGGAVQAVDEPTGGLILDSNGNAILNPFYDPRVVLIEEANRVSCGVNSAESQAAIEAAVTKGHNDLQVIMAYGDVGVSTSEKMIELCNSGALVNPVDKVATFCSDATDVNVEAMKGSVDNSVVFRGVMAAGDLIKTVCEVAKKMVAGEEYPEYAMEPLSYVTVDTSGNTVTVMYADVEQLTPDISEFFVK